MSEVNRGQRRTKPPGIIPQFQQMLTCGRYCLTKIKGGKERWRRNQLVQLILYISRTNKCLHFFTTFSDFFLISFASLFFALHNTLRLYIYFFYLTSILQFTLNWTVSPVWSASDFRWAFMLDHPKDLILWHIFEISCKAKSPINPLTPEL